VLCFLCSYQERASSHSNWNFRVVCVYQERASSHSNWNFFCAFLVFIPRARFISLQLELSCCVSCVHTKSALHLTRCFVIQLEPWCCVSCVQTNIMLHLTRFTTTTPIQNVCISYLFIIYLHLKSENIS
jgi:hypothetical protein